MTKEEFYRDLSNYVMINNDVYRLQYSDPSQLNPTPITKSVFKNKFGFSEDDWTSLPEFEGYTVEPEHINFRQSVDGKWNLYGRVEWNPIEGEWPTINKLINHLYGANSVENDQVEELYDYHTVLIKYPKMMQQARILYSHQQGTSKSALAVLESNMFGSNYTKVRESEFAGDFNMLWIRSLIIHMDEPHFLQPRAMSRKIRDLVTAETMNLRKMKTDHQEVPFYGKLLFTTNDSNFMPIEAGDRRYWIREVPAFKKEDEDVNFNQKMIDEIPHYIHFLLNREMKYQEKSDKTFWLPYEAISGSNAFQKMVEDTKEDFEVAAQEILENWFVSHRKDDDVLFRIGDLKQLIANELRVKYDSINNNELVILLRDKWGLDQPKKTNRPKAKDKILIGGDIDKVPGKWWSASREKFHVELNIFDDVNV